MTMETKKQGQQVLLGQTPSPCTPPSDMRDSRVTVTTQAQATAT